MTVTGASANKLYAAVCEQVLRHGSAARPQDIATIELLERTCARPIRIVGS